MDSQKEYEERRIVGVLYDVHEEESFENNSKKRKGNNSIRLKRS